MWYIVLTPSFVSKSTHAVYNYSEWNELDHKNFENGSYSCRIIIGNSLPPWEMHLLCLSADKDLNMEKL